MFDASIETLAEEVLFITRKLDALKEEKKIYEKELALYAKHSTLFKQYKKDILCERLEYLRCEKEGKPYSEELFHRHIDGQIAEVRWQLGSEESSQMNCIRVDAAINDVMREKDKAQRKIEKAKG